MPTTSRLPKYSWSASRGRTPDNGQRRDHPQTDRGHFTEQAGLVLAAALMPQIVASGRAQITRVDKGPHH